MTGPFSRGARIYREMGWEVVPVTTDKQPMARNITGREGIPFDDAAFEVAIGMYAKGNIALRLTGLVGIDVDAYGDKLGAETLAALEKEHGQLPLTYMSTSRDDGVSGIRLYSIPYGVELRGALGPGIDIVQRHHRTCVVRPSIHASGREYRWLSSMTGEVMGVPKTTDIPKLPTSWLAACRKIEYAVREGHRDAQGRGGDGGDGGDGGAPDEARVARYRDVVLAREIQAVMDASEGQRNDLLNARCFVVATLIPHGVFEEDEVRDAFSEAGLAVGLGVAEVLRTVDSAVRAGARKGRPDHWPPPELETVIHLSDFRAATEISPEPVFDPQSVTGAEVSDSGAVTGAGSRVVDKAVDKAVEEAGEEEPGTPKRRRSNDLRPKLSVSNHALAAEELREILGAGPLSGAFLRGEFLVHTPRIGQEGYLPPAGDHDRDGEAQIQALTARLLKARIEMRYNCGTNKEKEEVTKKKVINDDGTDGEVDVKKITRSWEKRLLPTAIAENVFSSANDGLKNLRILRGVTHTPMLRADGTVLRTPGYDDASGLLYLPATGLVVSEIPDEPSDEAVRDALALIRGLVCDFPWVTKHHEANYIGALMVPIIRPLLVGASPLVCISAPMQGSGKSLLADVLDIVHGAVFRSEFPSSDDEFDKSASSILLNTSSPIVWFDNVSGVLKSSKLAGLLTSTKWSARILGVTAETPTLPNDRMWVVTGNNLLLDGDIPRRALEIIIDPDMPNPHLRTGYKIPDLKEYVSSHRGEIIVALLTIARGWIVAGRPVGELFRTDTFAQWGTSMRGLLEWAGMPGVFWHEETAGVRDGSEDDEWRTFLEALWKVFELRSFTTKDIVRHIENGLSVEMPGISVADLPMQLAEKLERHPKSWAISLSKWIKNRNGRWVGGLCIKAEVGKARAGFTSYRIHASEQGRQATAESDGGGSE